MMAEIKCPMCGKPNPAELAVCQFCEARLKPLTDELSRSQPPIRPGEEPRDMDTGQLERALPGWLREIREQARESADLGTGKPAAQEEKSDLLAGLHSQSKSEEEIPDWLTGLRSEGGQVGFEEAAADEDDLAALRNMLGEEAPGSKESEAGASPGWPPEPDSGQAEASPSGSDFRWEADFGTEPDTQAESPEDEKPFDSELPAWLQDTDQPQVEEKETESELPTWLQEKGESPPEETATSLPAWLASLGEETGEGPPPQDTGQPGTKSTTDWLASFEEENLEAGPPKSAEAAIKSTTDWLASIDEEPGETPGETDRQQEPAKPNAEGEAPAWLSSLGKESPELPSEPAAEQPASVSDLPTWLAALGEESGETLPQAGPQTFGESETPDWLASFGKQSEEEVKEEEFSLSEESAEPAQATAESEIPDWLAAMSAETTEPEEPAEELDFSNFASDQSAEKPATTSAFVDDEGKPISKQDMEAIFSMDMPDWLSETGTPSELESPPPAEEPQADELRPAELPSWVQAMRPVESVISETEGGSPAEQAVEERGPLAGLRGVLPAAAGQGTFSKPRGYSIKLQVNEDQQSSAALLERMLSEEITPKAVVTQKVVFTQRILRWLIAALLLLVLGTTVYLSPQINPVPTSVPPETSAAWDYIRDILPSNAPVLLVFDYEAARAGEMEAAAAPLVDQMLTLKAPRLSLVASTPVGAGLAERFIRILQLGRPSLARNENFVNLGYLPGGPAGVQAFSGNPKNVKPLTTTGEDAWATPVLQDVAILSEFKAIFLLTDDVETARIWIEQTEGQRGEARFLVVSSAQSAPMLLPYVRSRQVDGMVTGLDGGAPIEQANSGRPGMARRYWDAYGLGLLTAVLVIFIGSLWSLISGWRTLRKEQGEG
jgi:hypothetical protein